MHRRSQFLLGVFFLAILQLAGFRAAYGQGGATGAISGVVVDSSGSTVADAEVQITSRATGSLVRKIRTTSDGSFVATLLPPGSYSVVVNKSGFAEARAENLDVRVT